MKRKLFQSNIEFEDNFDDIPLQLKHLSKPTIGGGSGGGGGGAQQVTSTVTQSNLPAYVQPYFEQVLQRGLFESARPYQPYGGQRLAQFAPEETAAQRGIAGLQRPEQLGMASDIAAQVGYGGMPSGMAIAGQFQPGAITPTYQATEYQTGYGPGQFGANYQAGQVGPGYQAGVLQPQFQATQFAPGYQAREFQPGYGVQQFTDRYQAGTITPGYEAGVFTPGYQAGQLQAGFEAGSMAAPGTLASYMSPYQQAVTDIERREAVRASEAQRPQVGAGAARAGALGGTRATLLEAERQRALGQQLGDIQARGSQAAFEQARVGFEADRAARLQQAQFGLGAFQAQEAARQRAAEMGFQAQQAGESARQEAARLGLSAQQQNEAARQAQAEFGLRSYQAGQEERQFAANLGLQAQQAGEQARQRAAEMGMTAQQQAEASRQAAEEFRQKAFQQTEAARQAQAQLGISGFQAQEAARQQQAQFQLQSQQAGEQARQEAARLGLTAQQQSDAARRAEQEFRTQAQQFNIEQQRQRALLGLEGLSADRASQAQRLAAAELLSGFGGRQQEMDLQRLAALGGVGAERRGLMQRGLDLGYEDFLRQQAYGREQLGYLSNLLQGVPVTPGSTVSTFGRVPSPEQQALGAGLGALGLYQAFGGRGRQG
jgi:hypothetical protein